jgi:uncharacterized protein YgiB involved in biofilm formation
MSKRRRSTAVSFTALTFAAGTTLAACGQPQPVPNARAPESAAAVPQAQAETGFASLQECKDAAPAGVDCDAAWSQALAEHAATAPAFANQQECEAQWGEGQCQTTQRDGGSVFIPLMAGLLLGRMLSGGLGPRPVYRDRAGGYHAGGAGGRSYLGSGGFGGGAFRPAPAAGRSSNAVAQPRATTARGGFGSTASGRSVGG